MFKNCGALIWIIDAQDDNAAESVERLHDVILRAYRQNPKVRFEVFVHKCDADLFTTVDQKSGETPLPTAADPEPWRDAALLQCCDWCWQSAKVTLSSEWRRSCWMKTWM